MYCHFEMTAKNFGHRTAEMENANFRLCGLFIFVSKREKACFLETRVEFP